MCCVFYNPYAHEKYVGFGDVGRVLSRTSQKFRDVAEVPRRRPPLPANDGEFRRRLQGEEADVAELPRRWLCRHRQRRGSSATSAVQAPPTSRNFCDVGGAFGCLPNRRIGRRRGISATSVRGRGRRRRTQHIFHVRRDYRIHITRIFVMRLGVLT